MQSYDDCEWPDKFEQKDLPAYVLIYYFDKTDGRKEAAPPRTIEDSPKRRSVASQQRLADY